MRYGTCRVVLFTSSIRAMPTIQSMYYMSSERSFQLEYNAVEIVGNGPVVMENSGIKLDRIISQVWKALSYFPHISSSTLWNLIKFVIYGKLFPRRIQPFEYHGLKIKSCGGLQQIPE